MVEASTSSSSSRISSSLPSTTTTTVDNANGTISNKDRWRQRQRHHRHLVTNTALASTACTIVAFFILLLGGIATTTTTSWIRSNHLLHSGRILHSTEIGVNNRGRALEDVYGDVNNEDNSNSNSSNGAEDVTNGDYSSFRCDEIYINTPSYSYESSSDSDTTTSSSTTTNKRCQYAQTCGNNSGLLFPFVFCHNSFLSPMQFMILLSPFILLLLTLLFRLLGSTADEYFSPALEMFSSELGLPPRFAGVTLLALGNGASDVSATMNAVWSDPTNGYKMSLGALTGASMFVTTIVAGMVILANGGVVCRGALLRDVSALGVTVVVVALSLLGGEVGSGVSYIYLLERRFAFVARRLLTLLRVLYHSTIVSLSLSLSLSLIASPLASGPSPGNTVCQHSTPVWIEK